MFVIKKCVKFGARYEQLGLMMEQLGFGVNQVSHNAKEGILAFNRRINALFVVAKVRWKMEVIAVIVRAEEK